MGSRCSSLARARRPIIHPSPRRARASTVHRIAAALQRNAAPYLQASTPLPISLHSATCSPRNPDKTTKTPQPFFLFTPSQEEKSRVDGDTCQPNRTDPLVNGAPIWDLLFAGTWQKDNPFFCQIYQSFVIFYRSERKKGEERKNKPAKPRSRANQTLSILRGVSPVACMHFLDLS